MERCRRKRTEACTIQDPFVEQNDTAREENPDTRRVRPSMQRYKTRYPTKTAGCTVNEGDATLVMIREEEGG